MIGAPTHSTLPVVKAITSGPGHHWFGYYEKCPWDATGRWVLAMRSSFRERPPEAGDVAVIGMIDTENDCAWRPLAETRAWNWQQGSMLQWLGDGSSGEIIFNDRDGDTLVSRILNVNTGGGRTLGRPVYAVNRAGTKAVSLNFARLHHQRPGYGYAGVRDPWEGVDEPADDGLWAMDLRSGESRLILSVAEVAAFQRREDFDGKTHRFNHAQFGPGDRFAVLHRRKTPDMEVGLTRLLTLDIEGRGLRCLTDHELVSHYDWWGRDRIVAWARRNEIGARYFLFEDKEGGRIEAIGEDVLNCDGHCSFSPDGRWMLSDTYPDETHHRTLFLFEMETGQRVDLGRFLSPPAEWQIRCDLHPRWSRDGRKVCIDSIHEGSRQMYVLDVSEITGR
jgi:Periplasmic component of the Tol biopolymer transport system